MIRKLRDLSWVGVLVPAAMLGAALTAPAMASAAAASSFRIDGAASVVKPRAVADAMLVRLTCHSNEDWLGSDEAYLNFNGKRIWGPSSINDGQSAELGIVREFDGQAKVDLYDEDWPDADDYLGSIWIYSSEINRGLLSKSFTLDEANYTLFYRVLPHFED